MKTCKSYERAGKEAKSWTECRDAKLEGLLRSHQGQAQQFACKLAGNSDEARELVQAASYHVLRRWEKFDPVKSFGSWYLTIVRNLFVDRRRVSKRMVSMDAPGEGEQRGLMDVLPERGAGILEQLEREELAQAAHEAIRALTAKYQAVVRFCDLEGMRYEQAAQRLGVPVGTVRSRLWRARAALRRNPKLRRLA